MLVKNDLYFLTRSDKRYVGLIDGQNHLHTLRIPHGANADAFFEIGAEVSLRQRLSRPLRQDGAVFGFRSKGNGEQNSITGRFEHEPVLFSEPLDFLFTYIVEFGSYFR